LLHILALIALCLFVGCHPADEAEARNKHDTTIEKLAAQRARALINGAEASEDESGAAELR